MDIPRSEEKRRKRVPAKLSKPTVRLLLWQEHNVFPLATYEEAVEQLRCLIRESFASRERMDDTPLSTNGDSPGALRTERHRKDDILEKYCETEKYSGGEALRRNFYEIDCGHICEPVLVSKSCECLCCCRIHREECPVHRLT